jgi:hypothetical protein
MLSERLFVQSQEPLRQTRARRGADHKAIDRASLRQLKQPEEAAPAADRIGEGR